MTDLGSMEAGNYRYIPGVFQYSCGVAALPGYAIVRVRFSRTVPLDEGFNRIAALLKDENRPLTAFCACELRSPEPFTEEGFHAFNERYSETLADWQIKRGDDNPVARSNVCPEYGNLAEPGFHAFCFTVDRPGAAPSFVVSGSAETLEGKANYRDHIVARGDASDVGLRQKAVFVISEMERRMGAFGFGWPDTSAIQVYSVRDIHPLIAGEYAPRNMLANGISWHFNRPPVRELDYEMDCRRVADERVVAI